MTSTYGCIMNTRKKQFRGRSVDFPAELSSGQIRVENADVAMCSIW